MGPSVIRLWRVSREPGPGTSFLVVQIPSVVFYFSSPFILKIPFLVAVGWMEPCSGEQRCGGLGVKQAQVDRDRVSPWGHKWRPLIFSPYTWGCRTGWGIAGREVRW